MKYYLLILLIIGVCYAEECNTQQQNVSLNGYIYFPHAGTDPEKYPDVFLEYINKYGEIVAYEEENHFSSKVLIFVPLQIYVARQL